MYHWVRWLPWFKFLKAIIEKKTFGVRSRFKRLVVRNDRQFFGVRIDYSEERSLFGEVRWVHYVHWYISLIVNHDFSLKLHKAFLETTLNFITNVLLNSILSAMYCGYTCRSWRTDFSIRYLMLYDKWDTHRCSCRIEWVRSGSHCFLELDCWRIQN